MPLRKRSPPSGLSLSETGTPKMRSTKSAAGTAAQSAANSFGKNCLLAHDCLARPVHWFTKTNLKKIKGYETGHFPLTVDPKSKSTGKTERKNIKKLQILTVALLISLSVCALTVMLAKAVANNYSASMSPTSTDAGRSDVPYTVTFVNTGTGILCSGTITIPTGYSAVALIGVTATSNANWSMSVASSVISFSAPASASGISYGQAVTVIFTATNPASPGSYTLNTAAYSLPSENGVAFPPPGSQPIVTVNPALVAPAVSVSKSLIDQGQTTSLSSTAVVGGTSPYSFQWLQSAPGSGSYSSISGAASSAYTFATTNSTVAGTWSFELQVVDGSSALATSNSASVTVNLAPTVAISPSSWAMDVNQSETLSAVPGGGSGTYTGYQWYLNGVAQSGQTSPTFSSSPTQAGSYSVAVTVDDSLGVTSAQSSAASITVSASPSVSITPAAPVTLDVGQIQVFKAAEIGGSGTVHYQWYLDNSTVGIDNSSYLYTAAAASHSITCKVTDSASVPVTSPVSNAVSIMVNPALAAPSVSATYSTVDKGQSSILTSSVTSSGTKPYTFQWYSKSPEGSYAPAGSNSTSFGFATSETTAAGIWSFILQVKDDVGVSVNSSAVSVIVNPTISASAAAGGSISPSGSVNVNYDGNQVFTVTANSGYRIADVSVDGNSVGPVDSYTFIDVSASHTISATFTVTPMPTPSTTAPPTSSPAPTHVPKTVPTPTPVPSATTVTATPSSGPTVTPTTTWTVIAVSAVAIGLVFAYTVVLSRRRSEKKVVL